MGIGEANNWDWYSALLRSRKTTRGLYLKGQLSFYGFFHYRSCLSLCTGSFYWLHGALKTVDWAGFKLFQKSIVYVPRVTSIQAFGCPVNMSEIVEWQTEHWVLHWPGENWGSPPAGLIAFRLHPAVHLPMWGEDWKTCSLGGLLSRLSVWPSSSWKWVSVLLDLPSSSPLVGEEAVEVMDLTRRQVLEMKYLRCHGFGALFLPWLSGDRTSSSLGKWGPLVTKPFTAKVPAA
jgi:hypothetical protein